MSPSRNVAREDWLAAALRLMDSGRIPSEVTLAEICGELNATEESFYSHFRDMEEFRTAVAARWLAGRTAALPGPAAGAVQDPVDRIRAIQAFVAGTAARDAAMRRWAATDPAAADAVAEAERVHYGHLTAALIDLGFADRESEAVARVLAAAMPTEQGISETVLAILVRAAGVPLEAPAVEDLAGAEPGSTVRFIVPRAGLTADDQAVLAEIARRWAAGRAEVAQEPGQDREDTGEA